jgi:hypothetical protein
MSIKSKFPIIISTFTVAALVYGMVFLVTSVCNSCEDYFGPRHRPPIKQKKGMSREEWERRGPKPTPPPNQSDIDKRDRQGGWKY